MPLFLATRAAIRCKVCLCDSVWILLFFQFIYRTGCRFQCTAAQYMQPKIYI
jgi:hypothetical protein